MVRVTSLLVGSFNKPPASTLLKHLATGAPLLLEPEPENPYDAAAIRVLVDPQSIPEAHYPQLEIELPMQGATLEQVMSGGPCWLGYIAASGGKPLAKAQQTYMGAGLVLAGNKEIAGAVADAQASGASWSATLGFAPDGKPLVVVETEGAP